MRDYDSDDGFSLPSVGDGPPNNIDDSSDEDSAAENSKIRAASTQIQGTDSTTEVARPFLYANVKKTAVQLTGKAERKKPTISLLPVRSVSSHSTSSRGGVQGAV